MSRTTYVKAGVLLALVGGAVALQLLVGLPDQEQLRSALDGIGVVAVPAFIALYVGVCLLPVGPSALLTVVGGALLGFPVALLAVLVGAVLGSSAAFGIGRVLGRDAVRGLSNARIRELDARVRDHGFATVFLARLVPLVPFSTVNYAFGLTSVTWRSYVAATSIGIVPGSALYVAVGAYGTDPGSPAFLLAVAGLVVLTLAGVVRSRRSRLSGSASETADSPTPD